MVCNLKTVHPLESLKQNPKFIFIEFPACQGSELLTPLPQGSSDDGNATLRLHFLKPFTKEEVIILKFTLIIKQLVLDKLLVIFLKISTIIIIEEEVVVVIATFTLKNLTTDYRPLSR